MNPLFLGIFLMGMILLISSCTPIWGGASLPTLAVLPPIISFTQTPFHPDETGQSSIPSDTLSQPFPTLTATSTLEIPNPVIWVSPAVPDLLRQVMENKKAILTDDYGSTQFHLNVGTEANSSQNETTSLWYYTLVAPFPTLIDGVQFQELLNAWHGIPSGLFAGIPINLEESTLAAFSLIWGDPTPGAVNLLPGDQLLDISWSAQPSWAIIPFEDIQPRWKVLSIDAQSPIHNDFNSEGYPLRIVFNLNPSVLSLPVSNRVPEKLTILAMTGVTALVRGTADKMENLGLLYPGEEVREVLRAVDLAHISNEIPFKSDCPTPDPWTESLQFCSNPAYIALLEDVGTDIVELTGNHLMDYSAAEMLQTLDMYEARNWKYFGGGRDLTSAQAPLLIENHGNKLAFIGCNFVGPRKGWATETQPGSAPCNFDLVQNQIWMARSNGYIPIMTFQYEEYYSAYPGYREIIDFRNMVENGAVIVSGSQAHVPATMEFYGEGFIHYGLGNLFFDQMSHIMPDGSLIYDTRNLFIDRHVFYDGKYLGVELLSYKIENYARPRPMSGSERTEFLSLIFIAAGW